MSANRLRSLQQATAALARAVDSSEIAHELGRGVHAILHADGVFVASADLETDAVRVLYQHIAGADLPARELSTPRGSGAVARAARLGEPFEANGDDATRAAADDGIIPVEPAPRSLLVVPVTHGRRLLAVVGAHWSLPNAFDAGGADAVRTLATQAGMALSNAQLFTESERERRQSEALADAARAVGESLRMGEVVRLILRHANTLLRVDGACVALREGNYLHIIAAVGTAELLAGVHMSLDGTLAGRVVLEGTTLIANDVGRDPESHRQTLRFADVRKALMVPLVTARGVLGALMVFNREEDFGGGDARILQRLADQVGVAIVNARLFEEVTEASRAWTSTFDSIGVGMAIVDDDGCIVRYNVRARQLAAGGGPRELAGRPFYEAILGVALGPNDDRPVERALRDGALVRATMVMASTGRRVTLTAAPHLDRGAIVTFDWAPDRGPSEHERRGDDNIQMA